MLKACKIKHKREQYIFDLFICKEKKIKYNVLNQLTALQNNNFDYLVSDSSADSFLMDSSNSAGSILRLAASYFGSPIKATTSS